MSWFKRIKEGITTSTTEKKETPEGLWYKCPSCKQIIPTKDHIARNYVCDSCGYHDRIGAQQYFEKLLPICHGPVEPPTAGRLVVSVATSVPLTCTTSVSAAGTPATSNATAAAPTFTRRGVGALNHSTA